MLTMCSSSMTLERVRNCAVKDCDANRWSKNIIALRDELAISDMPAFCWFVIKALTQGLLGCRIGIKTREEGKPQEKSKCAGSSLRRLNPQRKTLASGAYKEAFAANISKTAGLGSKA